MKKSKKVNWGLSLCALVLMFGSGWLLKWTLNDIYTASTALTVISFALLSVFTYVLGATLMGYSSSRSALQSSCKKSSEDSNVEDSSIRANNGLIFAFLLIAAGMLRLCFNIEALNPRLESFFFSWQMLVLIVGFASLCQVHCVGGSIVTGVGLYFLLSKASSIYPDNMILERFAATYWPALIIIFGVIILVHNLTHATRRNKWHHCREQWRHNNEKDILNGNNDGKINYNITFGSVEQVILDPVFKGGQIETYFGGIELDLRRTALAEKETFLYLTTRFGGIEITIPDNWDVELRSQIWGGNVCDSRQKNMPKDLDKKLIIVAKCSFGAIEIK